MRFAVLLAVLALPATALADPKAEAQEHVERAAAFHKVAHYREALDELRIAYTLDPRPELLYAIGQIEVKLGDCAQAITFYERFLATKPGTAASADANEAMRACKNAPEPTKPPPVTPEPTQPPKPEPPAPSGPRPWYGDYLADGLVGGGAVLALVGLLEYTTALGDLNSADQTNSYDKRSSLVDNAHTERATAVVLEILAAGLVGGGVAHYVITGSEPAHGIAIVPTSNGGFVTLTGRF